MKKGTTRDDPHNPLSTILGLADHRNGSVMHAADGDPGMTLELWDYRRRVADLYSRVRRMEPAAGWTHWVSTRNDLFRTHPQSPVPASGRASFPGLSNFDYDPELRVTAMVEPAPLTEILISHSGPGATPARTFGRARFRLGSYELALAVYWVQDYGGGVSVPFADATNGSDTYGGGRYLLDTAKGADLGHDLERVTLDFNFAYHPSCVHDPRWTCPLPPAENRLPVAVHGGERLSR